LQSQLNQDKNQLNLLLAKEAALSAGPASASAGKNACVNCVLLFSELFVICIGSFVLVVYLQVFTDMFETMFAVMHVLQSFAILDIILWCPFVVFCCLCLRAALLVCYFGCASILRQLSLVFESEQLQSLVCHCFVYCNAYCHASFRCCVLFLIVVLLFDYPFGYCVFCPILLESRA